MHSFQKSPVLLHTLRRSSDLSLGPIIPNSNMIVSGSSQSKISIWDIQTGEIHFTLKVPENEVRVLAISPDGTFIISASRDTRSQWSRAWDPQYLRIWDTRSFQERATIKPHAWVTACAISPDSTFIVSGGFYSDDYRDETVDLVIWDAQTGKERMSLFSHSNVILGSSLHGPGDFISACAISPDGSMIVSSHDKGRLRIWDVNTGRERANFIADSNSVSACAISPDGTLILSKGSDGILRLWATQTLQERDFLHNGVHKISGCYNFSRDNSLIISGTADGILQLWNMWTGELDMTWQGHSGSVDVCSISPNGYFVASKGSDGIKVWDLRPN